MKQQPSDLSNLTTTEELIVQYLDGELVRKELESMLFERLAKSPEARTLLREHLSLRGAIRSSLGDEMYQLSSDIDDRTRGRIEQMLQTIALEAPAGIIATPPMAPDAAPVATNPATRGLKRWAVRPSYAALLLLLAIGTTWYVTRTTTLEHATVASNDKTVAPSTNQSQPAAPADQHSVTPSEQLADNSATQTAKPASSTAAPEEKTRVVYRTVIKEVPVKVPVESKSIAQTVSTPSAPVATPAKREDAGDANDIMFSRHYAKILDATSKREVVVTSHDRL